mgnify:CR=1 FL=1
MFSELQGELFGLEDYSYTCRNCRGEFPRSIEFFPKGRCKDKLASFCRKCSNSFSNNFFSSEKENERSSKISLTKKTCEECGGTKSLREFYMSSFSFDGKTKSCKKCVDENYNKVLHMRQKYFDGFSWVVYFVQDSRNKRLKIGTSEDPYQKLAELQQGSSEKLNLLAIHYSGEKDDAETLVEILFSLFKSFYKCNGWFEMAPSLEQYIYSLNSSNDGDSKRLLYSEDINKKKYRLTNK